MKMKKFLLLLTLAWSFSLQAQDQVLDGDEKDRIFSTLRESSAAVVDSNWTVGCTTGLQLSQVYLKNWAAGGQTSVSGTALVNAQANLHRGKISFDNSLDLAYGLLRQGDEGVVLKTDDRIDLASKFGYEARKNWYYSALFNFRTQFAPGYNLVDGVPDENNVISDFLAPAYGLLALGLDYQPSDRFTAFVAPVTYKMTLVMNDSLASVGAYGVTPGENFRSEVGGYVRFGYSSELVENVTLSTRIDLFSNYLNNPQNIDIHWDVLVSMKVNEFMTTTITTNLMYDNDVILQIKDPVIDDQGVVVSSGRGPGVQFKEVLAIGFNYKF